MRAAVLAWVVLLAGCSSTSPPTSSGTGPTGAANDLLINAPTWHRGDAWTFAAANGTLVSYVVTEDKGTDWWMDTDSAERAFADARDDVSRLGPQRKSDLAGSQGSDRVAFFQWPLTDGKTWSTPWDHRPVTVTASVKDNRTAHLVAKNANGTIVYDYVYDAAAHWFSRLTHYGDDGQEQIAFTLDHASHNWTGKVVRYGIKELYQGVAGGGGSDTKQVQTDASASDIWMALHMRCGQAGYLTVSVTPMPPDQSGGGYEATGPCGVIQPSLDFEGPLPGTLGGTWNIAFSVVGDAPSYGVLVLQRTRTALEVPFPSQH